MTNYDMRFITDLNFLAPVCITDLAFPLLLAAFIPYIDSILYISSHLIAFVFFSNLSRSG